MKDICRTGMPDWKEGMAMSFIEVEHVNKTFRINKRSKGLAGMAANLVRPRYEYRRAVSDMNFTINEGEMVETSLVLVISITSHLLGDQAPASRLLRLFIVPCICESSLLPDTLDQFVHSTN